MNRRVVEEYVGFPIVTVSYMLPFFTEKEPGGCCVSGPKWPIDLILVSSL